MEPIDFTGAIPTGQGLGERPVVVTTWISGCLLYTSDAADERSSVDLGGRRIIKKKKETQTPMV